MISTTVALLATTGAVASSDLRIVQLTPVAAAIQTHVILSDGTDVLVPLVRVEPVAVLRTQSGKPQLLLSGATCTECDMNQSVYLVPINGKTKGLPRYSYPGTFKTYDTQELVEKTQMFFGRCLSTSDDVVVWFSEYFGDDRKWHKSYSVLRAKDEGPVFSELPLSKGSRDAVVGRTNSGLCKELPGTDGYMES